MINFFKKKQIQSLIKKAQQFKQARLHTQPAETEIAKENKLYYKLAEIYEKLRYNKDFPRAETYVSESYRSAALLGDANASYLFAKELLEKGKFWQKMNKSVFACKAHEKYATDAYEEAFAYLNEAIKRGHPLAKRLVGLATINGWGVPKNLEQGFEMVVASIEQEGTWDKATQIFEQLGLNRPEFFAYLGKGKKGA